MDRKLTIITADDDPGMRLIMKKLVEKAEGYVHLGEAEDGEKLVALFDEMSPDVVPMDVEMPGMTGIECARYIQDKNPRTAIIFATAHEEYMKSAFEVYAFDYLVKPFKAERALNTLALIRERRFGNPETQTAAAPKVRPAAKKLMLRHKEGMSFLDLTDILLIQREERSTVIYTVSGEKFITADSLSELDERLPDDMFFRTHKSYIVNLAHIESITPYGRWTYVIKLAGTRLDALITHDRYAELQQMYE
jgi:two-component system LytT family response regulator